MLRVGLIGKIYEASPGHSTENHIPAADSGASITLSLRSLDSQMMRSTGVVVKRFCSACGCTSASVFLPEHQKKPTS